MSSPVATIVPPDSDEATEGVAVLLGASLADVVAVVAVAAEATFCTSLGSAGAACVVVEVGASFFSQPNGRIARIKIEIVVMVERVIAGLLPLQQLL